MKHFAINFKPDNKQISIHAGATILEAASQAGIILNSVCGGKGTCGKCRVIIEQDGREVLACQYEIDSDVTVTIPAESRFFEPRILEEGIDIAEKVEAGIEAYGLAVDVGTTTVVAKLLGMGDGQVLSTAASINPQVKYGDDCVSRIAYGGSEEGLERLHKEIIACINRLTGELGVDSKQIHYGCIVGNATMNHLFLKLPVAGLGQAPYKAYSLDGHDVAAGELGLEIAADAQVHTVENIAGFVGSDITAAVLASGVAEAEELTLFVDIGTNGEIVLGTKDKLYAASCAAGPAFEGARISCGSRAVEGAIEAVVFDGEDIDFDVIGGGPARSICGSGLIDAVALLLELGIIEPSGRFLHPDSLRGSVFDGVVSRVSEYKGQRAFVLSDALGGRERPIVLTQDDVRQSQLAKAAVRAGIKFLQRKLGVRDDEIEKVLLAGAFGNYIRPDSALRIGLLPDVPVERIHFVGNAAVSGAQMILLSRKARKEAARLARKIEYVEIANEKDFTDVFAESMTF